MRFLAPLITSILADVAVSGPPGVGTFESTNLALGRVPTGSSDSLHAPFAAATDGRLDQGYWWRAAANDYPSFLVLDLGAPAVIVSMHVTGGDSGFKTLKTFRSDDARSWTMVQKDPSNLQCFPNSTTEHSGWQETARYVMIQMEDPCTGIQKGRFSIAEWSVYGFYQDSMVKQFAKMWPHCANLGPCFSYVQLRDAKANCLNDTACDGFSFSNTTMDAGRGSGCYKTSCPATSVKLGRGSHGYWVKRRQGHLPSLPSYFDKAKSGLESWGP